ncbi:NAD(P)H-dependent oxidoreductase [Buchananella felis]|uniref:NADPH-dependent FMN reductase n=1 Tax=Buchananella felis TaxID=3231492 RepID=UPI003528D672
MRIAIILGSTREGRFGDQIAKWVDGIAQGRSGEAVYELVDLVDFELPFFNGPVSPKGMNKEYSDPRVREWSAKIDSFDGFVFVTPEYNYSVPAPFKNAVDTLGEEWQGKPVAFAGYGYGGGLKAISVWRNTAAGFKMPEVEQVLSFSLVSEVQDGAFTPAEGQEDNVNAVLDALEQLTA